jgi:hypothetical protein
MVNRRLMPGIIFVMIVPVRSQSLKSIPVVGACSALLLYFLLFLLVIVIKLLQIKHKNNLLRWKIKKKMKYSKRVKVLNWLVKFKYQQSFTITGTEYLT